MVAVCYNYHRVGLNINTPTPLYAQLIPPPVCSTISKNTKLLHNISQTELENACVQTGAKGKDIQIYLTVQMREASRADAVFDSKAKDIFNFYDRDELYRRSLPKATMAL